MKRDIPLGGIAGFTSAEIEKNNIITSMIGKIIHRGPSAQEYYTDNDVAMGQCSLDTNNQLFKKDNLAIVFDGNLYNKEQLQPLLSSQAAMGDEEAIIAAYEKWGSEAPKYLRGNFSFAIWDNDKKVLFGARDHFGVKPFYYHMGEDAFIFASEIKSILAYPGFSKEFNADVVSLYLTFSFNPHEETFFKGIFCLGPGQCFTLSSEGLSINKYFVMDFTVEDSNMEETVELIDQTVRDAVAASISGKEKIGVFLSSGVDSSYITSIAMPSKTFTVGYDEKRYDETEYAKRLSDSLGIPNATCIVNKEEYLASVPEILYHLDEPISDPATIALYFGMKSAQNEVDVVFTGEGADEFFGGYPIYQDRFKGSFYSFVPFSIRRAISKTVSRMPSFYGSSFLIRRGMQVDEWYIGVGWVFTEDEKPEVLKLGGIPVKEITSSIYSGFIGASELNKMLAIDTTLYLTKNFLVNVDKMSAMFSMDARSPFTDIKVFDVARKLEDSAKINKETTKVYLREAAKKSLPIEIYKKRKLGFPVPIRDWLKEDLFYNEIKEVFNSSIAHELFDNKKIISLLDNHKNNKEDNYKKIWNIYILLKWHHSVFTNETVQPG
ncbi:MAG: asparagine synthase (glutamine-hydrolyzing) [Eubacteriaceae bacterium]|nr:asparagine synthase (glutamine-hydrolyzing) [Eubacteriaceae bacterium]